jgi:hypothetical protein
MAIIALNRNPTPRQLRWFGLLGLPLTLAAVAGALALKSIVLVPLLVALGAAALASLALGLAAPRLLRPAFVGIQYVTFPLGFVLSHVLVAVLYFVFLMPLGLVLRLFGRDQLGLKLDRQAGSYWIRRHGRAAVERYFWQY